MPSYLAPGVYIEELPSGSRPIAPVGTSTAAFIGVAQKGPVNQATLITNFSDFQKIFGGPYRVLKGTQEFYLFYSVQHFFAQGGARCYIVRILHYGDPEVANTITATAASRDFNGTLPDNSAVAPALTISAISPGLWGSQELEAEVLTSSKFTALLNADIAVGVATQIALQFNDQVQVGSLLWIVEEVVGHVAALDTATGAVAFNAQNQLSAGGAPFNGQIAPGIPVFAPAFGYIGTTVQAAPVPVVAGVPTPTNGIVVSTVGKVDGSSLRPGDVLTFAITQARLVVNRVDVQAGATVVQFASQTLPAFSQARSRVYVRDFTVVVKSRSLVVETHANLSLVDSNLTDHVDVRLGPNSGASQYIVGADQAASDLTFINDTGFMALSGGNDGLASLGDADFLGSETLKTGLNALTAVTDASILVIPNADEVVTKGAMAYCERRRYLFMILERPNGATADIRGYRARLNSKYAAIYHPWISTADAFTGRPLLVPPSGAMAGIYATTDSRRGVHKAPAGLDTGSVTVADGLETIISKGTYDTLYPIAINAILKLPDGITVWGSRTLSADPAWLQISIRRLFIFLEQSIENGTQWVTFEPNDPTLWKSIERNVGAFLRIQWLDGKLVGATEAEAFFVKCDAETNPREVVDAGQVVTLIGAAPSRPAEFVIFRIQQQISSQASG